MTERIAIIGGAGYVGSHAAKAVARAGALPVVIDNLRAGHAHAVQWGPLVEADIHDTDRIAAALKEHGVKAAMMFAASIEVGIGEREPLAFYDNNVAGMISVLRAMAAAGVDALLFSSTCAVYGAGAPPLLETSPIAPVSVYGRTKAYCEQIIADSVRAHGLKAGALRYFNACGADPDGDIGEEHDPETHLIPNALKAAAGIGAGFTVFGTDYDTPDGTCLRDYVHVTDLADAHVAALAHVRAQGGMTTLNLGTGRPYSVREVIAAVERVTGRAVPATFADRRAGDAPVLTADISAARRTIGFEPRYSDLETIVGTAWRFHQKAWTRAGLIPVSR